MKLDTILRKLIQAEATQDIDLLEEAKKDLEKMFPGGMDITEHFEVLDELENLKKSA